jgi:gamma-glutamyltranspeptidase/glutathione hydrolase
MLKRGGNAIDAAVAAAFALAVAEPTQSGLGGRTQILLRLADGSAHGIDGTTQVPAGYDAPRAATGEHGHGAVGIPGTVAALTQAQARFGTLSLADVMAPAEQWALQGLHLPEGEARRLAAVADELDPSSPLGRAFLDADGRPLSGGDLLVQPDLASVLAAIREGGRNGFYRGDVARRIAEDMAVHGGFVTEVDLAEYRALPSQIGRGRFGNLEVLGSYLPASGVTVVEILQVLDRVDVRPGDEEWPSALVESLRAGFADREIALGWEAREAVAWLTSDSLARRRAEEVANTLRTVSVADAGPSPRATAILSVDGPEPAFTTHVSVADTLGNVVALTQSLGPTLGARVVTPGLGFVYASTLGGYLEGGGPGYRPWSSQAPLILLDRGGPVLVVGGAGARRILSALVATLDRVVRGGWELDAAMDAPRLHPSGGDVFVEEGWSAVTLLEDLGYAATPRERVWFARLNAIEVRPDGRFRGVGDPRWEHGAAAGPLR